MSFAVDIGRFIERAGANADQVKRKIAIDVATELVERSPVDSGRFKNAWFASSRIESTQTIPDGDYPRNGQQALARAIQFATSANLDQTYYITNNLPYAFRLEYGYSSQAPQGMVRLTAARLQSFLNDAVREIRV